MKVIDKGEKYPDYLRKVTLKYANDPNVYIYGVFSIVGLGIYWCQDSFMAMLKVLFLLTTASSITFLLAEVFVVLTTGEIKKNKFISLICFAILLLTIVSTNFDSNVRYWSIILGLILFIPILITWIISKIRIK